MKKFLSTILLTLTFYIHSSVLIEDIRIEGLQRVSLGSVLDTLPEKIGERNGTLINMSLLMNNQIVLIYFKF